MSELNFSNSEILGKIKEDNKHFERKTLTYLGKTKIPRNFLTVKF